MYFYLGTYSLLGQWTALVIIIIVSLERRNRTNAYVRSSDGTSILQEQRRLGTIVAVSPSRNNF